MTTTHREKDITRFDRWSSTYEDSWMQRAIFDPAHHATLALAAKIVPQPASVLDVGCGTGRLLRQARTHWPEAYLIGVDPADGMIEMAKRLTPDATFFTSMAETLPLQDASVDLALSTISFHPPLAGPDSRRPRDRAGAASWRVLSPGRYVLPVLATPSTPFK
jgi:ubiquinone/menaquinone biosynthesis C-methylase UbiE